MSRRSASSTASRTRCCVSSGKRASSSSCHRLPSPAVASSWSRPLPARYSLAKSATPTPESVCSILISAEMGWARILGRMADSSLQSAMMMGLRVAAVATSTAMGTNRFNNGSSISSKYWFASTRSSVPTRCITSSSEYSRVVSTMLLESAKCLPRACSSSTETATCELSAAPPSAAPAPTSASCCFERSSPSRWMRSVSSANWWACSSSSSASTRTSGADVTTGSPATLVTFTTGHHDCSCSGRKRMRQEGSNEGSTQDCGVPRSS
mmetsp:Transcript_5591/g.17865  ORF Transcript_5591/g.17865 Transcript_5591/m.17865 type:complete len:267 (-) Transcript_5591:42-842(-)